MSTNFYFQKFVDNDAQQCFAFTPQLFKQTFLPIICILTEGEGDGIESRLPFKVFSTLTDT